MILHFRRFSLSWGATIGLVHLDESELVSRLDAAIPVDKPCQPNRFYGIIWRGGYMLGLCSTIPYCRRCGRFAVMGRPKKCECGQ